MTDISKNIGITLESHDELPLIAQYIVNENCGNRNLLTDLIHKEFSKKVKLNKYHNILKDFPVNTIWTTNYDCLLENTFTNRELLVVTTEQSLIHPKMSHDLEIIKLHGCVTQAASDIVLTQEDYDLFLYQKPKIAQKLRESILNKNILFLGYGYGDTNIKSILIQAYMMKGQITNSHFILLVKPDFTDVDNAYEKELRFNYWCNELRRLGFNELVVELNEYADILQEIKKRSCCPNVFVTGSHEMNDDSVKQFINKMTQLLFEKREIVLLNGQASGISHTVLTEFMGKLFKNNDDMNERIRFFPNPYAMSSHYSNDPTLISNLKSIRTPLISQTSLVIAFAGGIGTEAEVELAESMNKLIFPVILSNGDYGTKSIQKILKNTETMNKLQSISPSYHEQLKSSKTPTTTEVENALNDVLVKEFS